MIKHKPINIEYLKYLKEDSMLSSKDVMEIFGYKGNSSINDMIKKHGFPEADINQHGFETLKTKTRYWKKQTVLDYIKKVNEKTA